MRGSVEAFARGKEGGVSLVGSLLCKTQQRLRSRMSHVGEGSEVLLSPHLS